MQAHHRLSAGVLRCIEESPRIGVSPVSCFELSLAHRRGRLASADSLSAGYPELHGHLIGQPAAASPTP